MNANIKHLALSISVVVVLLCVFAGLNIASVKAIPVPNDYAYSTKQQVINTATLVPHTQFHLNKDFNVWTEDDVIISGKYKCDVGYWMEVKNIDDVSDC